MSNILKNVMYIKRLQVGSEKGVLGGQGDMMQFYYNLKKKRKNKKEREQEEDIAKINL